MKRGLIIVLVEGARGQLLPSNIASRNEIAQKG
jgi:hypothetical protein